MTIEPREPPTDCLVLVGRSSCLGCSIEPEFWFWSSLGKLLLMKKVGLYMLRCEFLSPSGLLFRYFGMLKFGIRYGWTFDGPALALGGKLCNFSSPLLSLNWILPGTIFFDSSFIFLWRSAIFDFVRPPIILMFEGFWSGNFVNDFLYTSSLSFL